MLLELIGKCTSCLLCTPAIEQRVRGNQRVNQGPSERQWDCGRGSCRGHRMGLGRINWNALFRMVYSVLVEWNASSLTRAMAGGAGHCSHRAESAGYQKHSEGTRKVNAPARASLKLGADGPAACSTGKATRMPPRPLRMSCQATLTSTYLPQPFRAMGMVMVVCFLALQRGAP